eukprot:4260865-Prorocentrum_lima.AAC.1
MACEYDPLGLAEPIVDPDPVPGPGRYACCKAACATAVCSSSAEDGSTAGLGAFWVDGVTPPNPA